MEGCQGWKGGFFFFFFSFFFSCHSIPTSLAARFFVSPWLDARPNPKGRQRKGETRTTLFLLHLVGSCLSPLIQGKRKKGSGDNGVKCGLVGRFPFHPTDPLVSGKRRPTKAILSGKDGKVKQIESPESDSSRVLSIRKDGLV
ncbi:hypothetical protein IE53DRAFT_387074 [Violaceomyces palustris]|uniref:Uncharacterized protein n=1 Tax=Violaceomyces palustris TaxID=1673888 RepID=A0ACD0NXS8_9BASI|nr:hypothetical protein IE53DRAFT_387074 [Violaceomyces palustris]